jgi:hypothetical protein
VTTRRGFLGALTGAAVASGMKVKAPTIVTAPAVERSQDELWEWWSKDPWNWMTGIDTSRTIVPFAPDMVFPHGAPIIWTTDERDNEVPVKPFPTDLEYLRLLTHTIISPEPEDRIVFIDKSRQMLVSTCVLLVFDWWCRFKPARRILWSKISEEQAADMLNEKVRAVHDRLPAWVQERSPMKAVPYKRLPYTATKSQLSAVNQKTAAGAARGGTATAIGVDEAAYQDYFEDIFEAAMPMAAKLVALTTAATGPPGATFFYEKISEGRQYRPAVPAA